jgi:branched-chain amino acid aminotransferase
VTQLLVSDAAKTALKSFQSPDKLPFGSVLAPVMITCEYDNGKWGELSMEAYRKIELDPTCKVLHYAQEIFEGLKAYRESGQGPFLFRAEVNAQRFNLSAKRMAMPEMPTEMFMTAVEGMTSHCASFIPTASGASLYIRPFMFASENSLGIKPSEKFLFMVVASPSQAYFKTGSVSVLVERDAVRAAPGGVGNAKTGGNYSASLLSMINANKKGYDQVLWLDPYERKNIEEMSGMNFFAVYGKELVTPEMTDTILDGITRNSLITLAEDLGYKVRQEKMSIDQLLKDIQSGECTEAFACGTAVIITPVHALGDSDGKKYNLKNPQGSVTNDLRKNLLDLQEGNRDDPFNWRQLIEPAVLE